MYTLLKADEHDTGLAGQFAVGHFGTLAPWRGWRGLHVLLFEHPTEGSFVVREHPLDPLVAHLLVL